MAIYKVQAPNGKVLKVEGPEGASDSEVTQFAAREFYSDPANVEKKYTVGQTLGKAFDRGTRRLSSSFGDIIPAIGASALGFDDYAEKQLDEAEQSEAYIQRNLAPKYPSYKDVDGVGSALEFAGETVFEQFPNLATMLVTGGVGTGAARIGAAKLGAQALAKREAVGQGTGVYLGSYALNTPEIFQNIYQETGQLAPGASLLFGAAAAGLDSVLPANILKGMTPAVKAAVAKEVLKKSGMRPGLAESIFKGALKGSAQEGLTEGAQEAISITAENFVADNPQIFDSQDWERIMESSVRGAVAGGTFRAVSAPLERLSTPANPVKESPATNTTVPTGTVSVDPELVRRKQASATALGLTLVPSPDIEGDFTEAIKETTGQVSLSGVPYTVRQTFNFDDKTNQWIEVNSEVIKGAIKEGMKDEDEPEASDFGQRELPGVKSPTKAEIAQGQPAVAEAPVDPNEVPPRQTTDIDTGKEPFLPFPSFPVPSSGMPEPIAESFDQPTSPQSQNPQDKEAIAESMGWQYDDVTNTAYDSETGDSYRFNEVNNEWEINEKLNSTNLESSRNDNALPGESGLGSNTEGTASTPTGGMGGPRRTVSKNSNGATVVNNTLGPEGKPIVTESSTWSQQFPGPQIASEAQQMGSDQGGISDFLAEQIAGENYVIDSVSIADLINSDPGLKEYIEGNPQIREFEQSDTQMDPIVTSKGEVLDGYNRIHAAMLRGDKTVSVLRGVKPWTSPSVKVSEFKRNRPFMNNLRSPRFKDAQEMKEELYESFGKKAIDRMLSRGFLRIVSSSSEVSDVNPNASGVFQWEGGKDRIRSGTTTLIADKNPKGSAASLLLHEVGEHYGLEAMLGKDYAPILNQLNVLKNTDPVVKEAWAQVSKHYPQNQGGYVFLKEVAAHIGETAPDTTWFQNLIMKVKQFLRKIGFFDPTKVTGQDIAELVMYSLKRTLNQPVATSRLNPDPDATMGVLSKVYSKENPPGAHSPQTYKKILKMAGEGLKDIPKGNSKMYQAVKKALGKIPDSMISMKMGLYGLVALNDLYKKYLPSLGKMLELLERRAGEADLARASVDRLGYMGMNIVKGNKRKAFKIVDSTGKEISLKDFQEGNKRVKDAVEVVAIPTEEVTEVYDDKTLQEWATVVYDLSRGEKGYLDKGIDPTDPNNKFHPMVIRFRKLPKELQMLAIAYSGQYSQFAKKFNAALLKMLPETSRDGKLISMSAKARKFKEQLISQELVFYHPFRRRGAYKLIYQPKPEVGAAYDTEPYTERFETAAELEAGIARVKREGGRFIESTVSPEKSGAQQRIPDEFFQQIIGIVNDRTEGNPELNEKIIDQMYELYINMFPSSSVRQQTRRRMGVRGEIQDIVGGFIDVGARMANQVTNMEYIPQFNEASTAIIEETATAQETISLDNTIEPEAKEKLKYQVAEAGLEITDRTRSFFNNPVPNRLSGNLAYVSFLTTIAGNVSSALVNLTQVLLIVLPGLYAKYGLVRGQQAMNAAISLYFSGGRDNNKGWEGIKGFGGSDISFAMKGGFLRSQENAAKGLIDQKDVLPQELLDLYSSGLERSVFRRGLSYELTEMRKKDSQDFTGVKAKVDSVLGWVFQNTERFNREVTYLASYMADRDMTYNDGNFKVGSRAKTVENATTYARDFTRESHGTALPELGPRHFQDGWGKVIFTFKRYAHAMMAVLIKLFYNSMKGGDARRDEIAREIMAINDGSVSRGGVPILSENNKTKLAQLQEEMQALKLVKRTARVQLAGIYGMSFTVAGIQGMPLYGAAETFSETMNAMFGDEDEPYDFDESVKDLFGELGYKGPLNKILDTDIASRTGFSNLIWRDDARRVQEIGIPGYIMETALGPSYSYARNIGRGVEDMANGEIYRGIEQTLPAFARNAMKSYRYFVDGARTRGGAELVDDLNGYNAFMQIFGFTNEDLSNAYERNNAMKQGERQILKRRTGLLTAAFLARDTRDREMLQEVKKEIRKYNNTEVGRLNRITPKTLNSSYKARKKAIEDSVNGITLSKKYQDYLRENLGS